MPESGSVSSQASTASSHREILAGEAAADEVGNSVGCPSGDIGVPLNVRPVVLENSKALPILLHLPRGRDTGALQTLVEAADA
jgi:hypothetical protein